MPEHEGDPHVFHLRANQTSSHPNSREPTHRVHKRACLPPLDPCTHLAVRGRVQEGGVRPLAR